MNEDFCVTIKRDPCSHFICELCPWGGVSMNKYELAVVFNPNLSEEDFDKEFENVKAMVENAGASIEKVDQWGKRKLAYEVRKFNEGFYNFIVFSSEASVPRVLESKLRITENVIRYLIVKQEN